MKTYNTLRFEDTDFIKENARSFTRKKLAEMVGVSVYAIQNIINPVERRDRGLNTVKILSDEDYSINGIFCVNKYAKCTP